MVKKKGVKRKGKKSNKGGQWERDLCRIISEWFSDGEADDWFWRSAGSGSRATIRGRKGKTTRGHGSDIAATCSEGEPFTKLFGIEAKRGYQADTLQDLVDRGKVGVPKFELWIQQAKNAATNQSSPHWLLITFRNRRRALVTISKELFLELNSLGTPLARRATVYLQTKVGEETYMTFKLDQFLNYVTPDDVMALYEDHFGD